MVVSTRSLPASSRRASGQTRRVLSKKQAAQRSQNAYSLNEEDVDEAGSDTQVRSEDDEEIDSDEAFESGDDERFNSFSFSGSSKGKRRKIPMAKASSQPSINNERRQPEIDLRETSEEEDAIPEKQVNNGTRHVQSRDAPEFMDSDSNSDPASDFENDTGEDLMDLSEMLGGQSAFTRDHSDASDETSSEASLSEDESLSSESNNSDDGDALENFVKGLEEKRKRSEGDALHVQAETRPKKRRVVEDNELTKESEYNLGLPTNHDKLDLTSYIQSLSGHNAKVLKKTQMLDAPLAKPIQDKLDRKAAYDTVVERMTKWQPTDRQVRELRDSNFSSSKAARAGENLNTLVANFKPTTELETTIDSILKASSIPSEKEVTKLEDLAMAKLSIEEEQKRRAELAKNRDMLFWHERKAQRQSKIKSKAYRRVHRKEREKARQAMQDTSPNDSGAALEQESRRARERMELRHKNTGKWAQKMLGRADHGDGSRAAITEQLQRGEQLERKIRGTDDFEHDDSDDTDDNAAAAESTIPDQILPNKGIFAMKFMREAHAREAAALRDDDNAEDAQLADPGRRLFRPTTVQGQASAKTKPSPSLNKALEEHSTQHRDNNTSANRDPVSNHDDDYNPWLVEKSQGRQKSNTLIEKNTDDSLKFAAKLNKRKQFQKHQGKMPSAVLDTKSVLPLKDQLSDDEASDAEESARLPNRRQLALKQADLVSQAFAGDDVVADFIAEKSADVERDAPQDIDETLPGWGSWTGDGVKASRKRFIKHVDGIKPQGRKDAKLQHVIINEKRMKQAKKYMAQSVPFPYQTKEQYERSLKLPIGPEWNTRTNFQKLIMPRVVKKAGQVIAPMERMYKD